jgi:hypothetical protein
MPIQTFTGEGAEPIAELRWEFDFETIELVYRGRMLGRLNNIEALKDRGIIVTTPDKRALDVHFESSKAGGEFRVFLDTEELHSADVQWGRSPRSADLPPEMYGHDRPRLIENYSYGYEKPILRAQQWLMYLGLLNLTFGFLTLTGKDFVPVEFHEAFDANLFTGGLFGAIFVFLSLITSRSRAHVILPIAMVALAANMYAVGQIATSGTSYAGVAVARVAACAWGFYLVTVGWQSARAHRIGRLVRVISS